MCEISHSCTDFLFSFCSNTECVAELSTVKSVPSTTNASCITQVEDLSVMWTTICFVGVSIVKITLCVISIWVNKRFICYTTLICCSLWNKRLKWNSKTNSTVFKNTQINWWETHLWTLCENNIILQKTNILWWQHNDWVQLSLEKWSNDWSGNKQETLLLKDKSADCSAI